MPVSLKRVVLVLLALAIAYSYGHVVQSVIELEEALPGEGCLPLRGKWLRWVLPDCCWSGRPERWGGGCAAFTRDR
jgi:hypothetical protein